MLDVNFEVQRKSFRLQVCSRIFHPISAVFGPSGSGKSTLLAAIAGLIRPQQGYIQLGENRLFDSRGGIWVPPHLRRIGLVFQSGQLFPHLSVKRNLLYGYNNIASATRVVHLPEVVELLEIGPLLERRPATLSGGEQQRVALGRALLYSPHLLLLDEPLSALDERLKQQILPYFLFINRQFGIPMLYVSHARAEIDFLTPHILFMRQGGLFAEENIPDETLPVNAKPIQ